MAVRTGIFGGSFNPIHKGHILLAEQILQSGMVDELWLMVSPQNPLKENSELWSDKIRLRLARLAVRNHPNIHVSDFEFGLPRPSYMYHTLEELNKTYPKRTFTLVIGADNWACFSDWCHSDDILKKYPIIIYPRNGFSFEQSQLPPNVTLLNTELYPISSTEIRERLQQGKDVSQWLDAEVERECKKLRSKA